MTARRSQLFRHVQAFLTHEAFVTGHQRYGWPIILLTHNGSRTATNCALCVPRGCSRWDHGCLFIWGHSESSAVNHESSATTQEGGKASFPVNQPQDTSHTWKLHRCTYQQLYEHPLMLSLHLKWQKGLYRAIACIPFVWYEDSGWG